jgi:branched-subunit amino acid transport protein
MPAQRPIRASVVAATFAAAFRNSIRILPFDITKLVQLPAGFERALRYEL